MLTNYYTVKGYGKHEIIIQKSRFITYVDRIDTEEKARDFIETIKKKHWDATHNCSAYLIGMADEIQKANDDGEPSGTAGVPMLEVLKKRQLKNTVVVVTRYFGGIKLGAGGLIRAYSKATSEGIDAVGLVEKKLMQTFRVTFDYHWLGKVENELRQSDYTVQNIDYLDEVEALIYVNTGAEEEFVTYMNNVTNEQVKIEEGACEYVEIEIPLR